MSNNVTLTPKVFARLMLMELGAKGMKIAKNMSTEVTPEFAKPSYKIGDTVEVRKPYRFVPTSSIGFSPQPIVDTVTPVSVKQVAGVHWLWDSVERTMDVRTAMRLYTRPAAVALGAQVNSGAAAFAANYSLNAVGTPGAIPSSQATYLAAGDRLIQLGLPDDEDLTLVVNRSMSSGFVNGTVTYFNPTGAISNQFSRGHMVDSMGYKTQRDEMINKRTNGVYSGTPLVNLSQTADGGNNATMTLNTDGWGSGVTSLKQGDRFVIGSATSATVGGVNSVHPQTRQSTGQQQVFTVQADIADTTGTINMVVAPAITPATLGSPGNQYANVDTAPVDNAIITMIGTSGVQMQQGLLLHSSAHAFVSVPMDSPPDGKGCISSVGETDPETGLSTSYIVYFDGDPRQFKHRFDILYDFGKMYGELCCVINS